MIWFSLTFTQIYYNLVTHSFENHLVIGLDTKQKYILLRTIINNCRMIKEVLIFLFQVPVQPIEPPSLDTQYSTIHKVFVFVFAQGYFLLKITMYLCLYLDTRYSIIPRVLCSSFSKVLTDHQIITIIMNTIPQHALPQSPSRRKNQNRSMARSVPGTLDR